MISVVNKRTYTPGNHDFYIGRGSPLGNPYTSKPLKNTKAMYQADSPEQSVNLYRHYIREQVNKKNKPVVDELNRIFLAVKDGHDVQLICYCAPGICHGNVIKEMIEEVIDLLQE